MNDLPENIKLSHGRSLFSDFLRENFADKQLINVFDAVTELYFQVNSIINISALKTADDIYVKHYLDSIFPYSFFSGECCDVGCGGGFPCIPLSVVTGLNFTGIDSVGKKLTLIKRCTQELGIKNLNCIHTRSEDLAKSNTVFDSVCCRAVADTDKALAFCSPLAKKDGNIILYKTQNDAPAQKQTESKCKSTLIQVKDYTLPGTDINRRLFVYKKTS